MGNDKFDETMISEMEENMRTLNLRINFFWDDGDDMEAFELTVPSNVSNAEILDTLKKEHEYLCEEDEEDVYGKTGRTPETLLNYICNKYYGWSWRDFQYDIDVNFN